MRHAINLRCFLLSLPDSICQGEKADFLKKEYVQAFQPVAFHPVRRPGVTDPAACGQRAGHRYASAPSQGPLMVAMGKTALRWFQQAADEPWQGSACLIRVFTRRNIAGSNVFLAHWFFSSFPLVHGSFSGPPAPCRRPHSGGRQHQTAALRKIEAAPPLDAAPASDDGKRVPDSEHVLPVFFPCRGPGSDNDVRAWPHRRRSGVRHVMRKSSRSGSARVF